MAILHAKTVWLTGLGAMVLGLFVTGCMVGPDYVRPQTPVEQAQRYTWLPEQWPDTNEPNRIGPWWQTFGDPDINDLVVKALHHNTDILTARASVQRAVALLEQAHGLRLPEASYSMSRLRQRMSFDFPPAGGRLSFMSETWSQGISVGYITDLFGRLRRTERAAVDSLLASEADCEALKQAIVAQVVLTRIQLCTQKQLYLIAEATIQSWQRTLDITEDRYQGGLTSPLDVYFAKQSLAAAQAQKTLVEQQLYLLSHALSVLVGDLPQDTELPKTVSLLPQLGPAPVGVPAVLLDRRPDIRAAEMRLAAATENVGVNLAGLYPDLAINASAGIDGSRWSDIFDMHNRVYALAIGLTAPVFQGGRLRAGVRAARADAEAAAQTYAGQILRAFQEVQDALMTEQLVTKRIGQYQESFQLAVEAEKLARDRYQQGAETILTVLETERNRRMVENDLAAAQGQRWEARVKLYLAIGGDWGLNPQPPAPHNSDSG